MRRANVLLLALGACVKAVVPPPEPPPPPPKPAPPPDPCAANLSGLYFHSTDPTWRYDARDDGGVLELAVTRQFDGGRADAGTAAMVQLRRSATGFLGEASALGGLPSGQTCPMTFPVRVAACLPEGLKLLSAADGVVGEGCATPARPRNPVMLEHLLTRADAGGMRLSQ